jgi:hypothetical protein
MKIKNLLTAVALIAASATSASAITVNLGDVTTGTSTTGTIVGTQNGDFYNFSLNAAPAYAVTTLDIDTLGSDFRADIGLYDAIGTKIADNAGFSGVTRILLQDGAGLANGDYTLVIGAYNVNYTADINDVSFNGFPSGDYNLNIGTTVSQVPLPAGGLLLLTGLAGITGVKRRKNRA